MKFIKGKKKYKCFLPPYEMEEVLSLQDARQKAGWGITAFNLPEMWKLSQGEGVKIAVLDTGVDSSHEDLNDNLLPGINIINKNLPPEDGNSHGSHCSGILSAENNDIGMIGIAPKAKIIPVKVLDDSGNGNLLHVAQGIRWAADNGADIINMSLGSPRPVPEVYKAILYACSKGIPIFCAAGNAGMTQDVFYPAAYKETIAIGSIDENFNRSSFSNTGQNLDFMAPGGKIFSTVPKNWYAVLQGTSMAAPFAVGVAALVLSYKRKLGLGHELKTADDYRKIFRENTIPITDAAMANKKFFQGFGIIDPRKLKEWLENNKN